MTEIALIVPNPISRFYRRDELAWAFLMDQRLLQPVELKSAHEFMIGMDRENIWQSANQETPRQYLERRFDIDKSDANKILKKLKVLGIIADVLNSRNALRINPWLANKSKFLSGYWEFEQVKLSGLQKAGFADWLSDKGLLCVGTLSYQRIKSSSHRKESSDEKIKRLEKHIEELMRYLDAIVEEHTRDTENFLRDQKEKDMLIQTMQKQHQENIERFERLIAENERQHEQTRQVITDFFAKMMEKKDVPEDVKTEARRAMFQVLKGGKA